MQSSAPEAAAEGGQAARQQPVGGQRGVNNIIAQNERTTDDEELKELFTFTPSGDGNAAEFLSTDMDTQVVDLYNNWLNALETIEEEQNEFIVAFESRLEERDASRIAYAEWRMDQQVQLLDTVNEWARRYDGSVAEIEGVRYELYKPGGAPKNTPRGTRVIETNYRLTPHDILNEDGTVRLTP